MVITYYGLSCFKAQSGDTVLAFDPYSKESGLTPPRFEAHAALSSHNHPNHNNIEALASKEEDAGGAFKITGPGEYEFKGIMVRGISSYHDAKGGKARGRNTIYVVEWEGMKIVHMGDYGEKELRSEVREALGTPDIMFIPVGGEGGGTIGAEEAAKLLNQIEPRIIIPMHYKISGLKEKLDGLEAFMKEMGEKNITPEERLTIKKKDLPSAEQSKIIVLKTP